MVRYLMETTCEMEGVFRRCLALVEVIPGNLCHGVMQFAIMVSCEYCGGSTGELAFECNYCGNSFCQAHRLPEAHDCTHISEARPPTSAGDEPEAFRDHSRGAVTADEIDLEALRERAERDEQPYSVVEVEHTVGSPPDPDFDSSPDVAVDGSIASEGDTVVVDGESQECDREEL